LSPADEENVIAALEHPDRIREITLTLTSPLLDKLTPFMQVPFPALEDLRLVSRDMMESVVLPGTFLGGSTPRLRRIDLDGTPFPALPRLLLTATDLVLLRLYEIPESGYFSPEALVTGLEATSQLKSLELNFVPRDPPSSPGSRNPRIYPETRVALPTLTEFQFRGHNEYLEDLIARIDAPNVMNFNVSLSEQRTFEFSQLAEFIGRTEEIRSSPHRTSIWLWEHGFSISHYFGSGLLPFLLPSSSSASSPGTFQLRIDCHDTARQMTLLTRTCRQLSLLVVNVERLDVEADSALSDLWDDDDETDAAAAQWLELLAPFRAVQRLELIGSLVLIPRVAAALAQSASNNNTDHDHGNSASSGREVFPSLRDLYLRGTCFSPAIESFAATRRLSGRNVSIHYVGDEGHDHDP
jgi:hypothetical protein